MAGARLLSACAHRSRARANARKGPGRGRRPPRQVYCSVSGRGRVLTLELRRGRLSPSDQRPLDSNSQQGPRGLFPDPVWGLPLGALDQPSPRPPPPATARGRSGPACEPSGKGRVVASSRAGGVRTSAVPARLVRLVGPKGTGPVLELASMRGSH